MNILRNLWINNLPTLWIKVKNKPPKEDAAGPGANPLILLCLLLSGACGLVYEILWMKMLTLTMGNTVFSITTVLTAFMGGLALGSFLTGRVVDKIRNPLKIYGLLEGTSASMPCCCRGSLRARSRSSALSTRASTPLFIRSACCAFSSAGSCCWCPPF